MKDYLLTYLLMVIDNQL